MNVVTRAISTMMENIAGEITPISRPMFRITSSFGAVEKVKGGDYDAFAALFAKYRRRLAALLHYKAGPELLAAVEVDDLLQETFLQAFRDIQRFKYAAPGSFWNWLASIAGHVVLDAARF